MDALLDAGHGKITLLIIPHFEHRVFRIQVSPFLFFFFVVIFAVLIGFFSFSVSHSNEIENRKFQLSSNKNQDEILIERFIKNFENISVKLNQIIPQLENVHFLIDRSPRDLAKLEKTEILYAMNDQFFSKENEEILAHFNPMAGEKIFESRKNVHIATLSYKLEFVLRNFQAIHSYVDAMEDVLFNIPSSWPVTGGFITSLWGIRYNPFNEQRDMHFGIDIAQAAGVPIRATAPGTVISSTFSGRYGNVVSIMHKYGFYTVYAHNHANRVSTGQQVYRGQIIAEVGQTGYATGPHCHYSIQIGRDNVNPYSYLMIY
jgi:murein DD-endopeptidase MepM/ murein hydrolase activator NlpD